MTAYPLMVFMLIFALQGCRTTRQVAREEVSQQQTQTTEAQVAIESQQETEQQNRTFTETTITESMDTVLEVFPVVDGKASEKPVSVTVRQKKVTQKREFADQKKQQTSQTKVLAEQNNQKTNQAESRKTGKQIQRPIIPWWLVPVFVAALLITGIVIVRRRIR